MTPNGPFNNSHDHKLSLLISYVMDASKNRAGGRQLERIHVDGQGGSQLIDNTVYQFIKGQTVGRRAAAITVQEIKDQSSRVPSTHPELGSHRLESAGDGGGFIDISL